MNNLKPFYVTYIQFDEYIGDNECVAILLAKDKKEAIGLTKEIVYRHDKQGQYKDWKAYYFLPTDILKANRSQVGIFNTLRELDRSTFNYD